MTANVLARKNADFKFTEKARGDSIRILGEQFFLADIGGNDHAFFGNESGIDKIIQTRNRKLALHFRTEVIDDEKVAGHIPARAILSLRGSAEFFRFKAVEHILQRSI